jgi:hypothetical protein
LEYVVIVVSEFPGTFESYWHFYHMGVRFGHWLGCAVVVDSKEREKEEVTNMRPADWHGKWCNILYLLA